MNIQKSLTEKSKIITASHPLILNFAKASDRARFKRLNQEHKIQHVIDDYEEEQRELYQVKHPTRVYVPTFEEEFQTHYQKLKKKKTLFEDGRWVYYPWLSTLVHVLEEKDFQLVRTARNRNLINHEEQEKFYNATIGIGGLSVGNSVALAIALQGGGRHIRLADHDRLALSNTNRIRTGVENLGVRKVEMTARQIYAVNPYVKVDFFSEGLNQKNVRKFFAGPPKLDIVIDELDNLAVKYLIREQASAHKIAVVMGADNGDNAVIDIERYDLNPKLRFFHGRIGRVTYEQLTKLDKFGIGKTITQHIGPENVTERMQQSLLEMGKTIVSWPQLGGAALLNGSAVAYCVRKILNNQPIEHNRALVSLDEKFVPGYNSPREKRKRAKVAKDFKKIF